MAVVFDSTVAGLTSNSYATVAAYNQYRENQGLATVTTAVGEVDLIQATAFVDMNYRSRWLTQSPVTPGTDTSSRQSLHWPQRSAYTYDGSVLPETVIPTQVKEACYQYAITRDAQSLTSLSPVEASNVKSQEMAKLGKKENFSAKSGFGLPDAFKFLDTILIGLIRGNTGGLQVLNMARSA